MCQVEYNQAMGVGLYALKTKGTSSRRLSNVRVVYTHVHLVVVGVDEAGALGSRLAEIVGVSLSRGIGSLFFWLAVA